MEKLEIKKREGILAWSVNAEGLTPNTILSFATGLVVFVKINGESKYTSKSGVTVRELFNPGKNCFLTKLFTGNKPYESPEVIVIDTDTQFDSEWGFSGLSCRDKEIGIRAKARSYGIFSYKIEDYLTFVSSLNFDETKDHLKRETLRDELRASCVSVVQAFLSEKIAAEGLEECQAHRGTYKEAIRKNLDKLFMVRGITVYNFEIMDLQYAADHEAKLDAIDNIKLENAKGALKNEGRRDDLTVEREEVDIGIGVIKAIKGTDKDSDKKSGGEKKHEEKKIFCSRCGEANPSSASFCFKCGEKLHK